jgi:hypothetical protein
VIRNPGRPLRTRLIESASPSDSLLPAPVEDVLRCALEAQDAEASLTDEKQRAFSAHIEQGYLQAERGELIDGAQARREIQAMKENWRLSKR